MTDFARMLDEYGYARVDVHDAAMAGGPVTHKQADRLRSADARLITYVALLETVARDAERFSEAQNTSTLGALRLALHELDAWKKENANG